MSDVRAQPKDVVARYPRRLPLRTRLFLSVRDRLTPYAQIASRLPERGRILDLGCGHGLLALHAALEGPERLVLGVDHDRERIAVAAEAGRGMPNVRFELATFSAPPAGPFAAIAMIDVLHYFAPDGQRALIVSAHERLEPGGTLLVREVDPEAGLAARWNRWYERIATGIGFTRTDHGAHHFRSRAGWIELLARCGFEASAERCSSALFADVLYVCRRRS